MAVYNCAVDGGNASINIVIDGEIFPIAFPSLQSDPISAKADYVNAVNMENMSKVEYDKLHVNVIQHFDKPNKKDEAEFLFGHMAEKYTRDLRSRQNFKKSEDRNLAMWMITALAYSLYVVKKNRENYTLKPNDILTFHVNLGTGLPYREGSIEENIENYRKMFEGKHRIEFKHPIFKNLTVELIIENALVFTEAQVALSLELNKEGGIYETTPPDQLLNKKMAIIDIGGHTTESLTIGYEMARNESELELGTFIDEYAIDEVEVVQKTLTHLTFGIERGIATIMEDVIAEIDNKYRGTGVQLRTFVRRDIEKAFTRQGVLNGKVGYILPEKIYVKDIFDAQARNLAVDIVQKTHAMYQAHNVVSEIDTIFLAGGGSKIDIVVRTIRNEFERLGYDKNIIKHVEDPLFSNAKGYYFNLIYSLREHGLLDDYEDVVEVEG